MLDETARIEKEFKRLSEIEACRNIVIQPKLPF